MLHLILSAIHQLCNLLNAIYKVCNAIRIIRQHRAERAQRVRRQVADLEQAVSTAPAEDQPNITEETLEQAVSTAPAENQLNSTERICQDQATTLSTKDLESRVSSPDNNEKTPLLPKKV